MFKNKTKRCTRIKKMPLLNRSLRGKDCQLYCEKQKGLGAYFIAKQNLKK